MTYDTFIMVDWSGGNDRGPTPKPDAIWSCVDGQEPVYHRNRQTALVWLMQTLNAEVKAKRRVLLGFDFPFGYPAGFGKYVCGSDDPLALWGWFADTIQDSPDNNNRFDVAGQINALWDGIGPFWGNGLKRDIAALPRKGLDRTTNPFAEKRAVETHAKGAFTLWQMAGAGSVGSQVMMGLPVLQKLRTAFANDLRVWPFEAPETLITLTEIWPSLHAGPAPSDVIKDAHQVKTTAAFFAQLGNNDLAALFNVPPTSEGWILGVPYPAPPLRNDCFAMPRGAYWTPVDDALAHLKANLPRVVSTKSKLIAKSLNRILADDVTALRSHPPTANSAVDGYGFAGGLADGAHNLPLVDGRAAAGAPYAGNVPQGRALRILTGAALPTGVDTVVLQEDVVAEPSAVRLNGPLKQGANCRRAGEDMKAGDLVLTTGRRLTSADIATAIAAGVSTVCVARKLRVGVLSTGDELAQPGQAQRDDQIYDANRPMLLGMVKRWGHKAIDLGCAPDNRDQLRKILDKAAKKCDVIITSGGASAGDEDHMAALLKDSGTFALWRIAVKPGRPMAMGTWHGTPVFGLPGNPVAAFTCAAIFARPALAQMAGGEWQIPTGVMLPAAFTKRKKEGRREYLRARLRDGAVEVFASEGSGRVSGLSWAEGLVELGDHAQGITEGDLVRFISFAELGL